VGRRPFALGDALLVALVFGSAGACVVFYVPDGRWVGLLDGKGPAWHSEAHGIVSLPIFVHPGTWSFSRTRKRLRTSLCAGTNAEEYAAAARSCSLPRRRLARSAHEQVRLRGARAHARGLQHGALSRERGAVPRRAQH
jgi:hypothetical protein